MNAVVEADPTHCNRCRASLERGWCQRWRGNVLVESVCHTCDDADRLRDYVRTKVLTSKIVTTAAIKAVRWESTGGPVEPAERVLAEVNASYERIRAEIKSFERFVWFAGLQAQVRAASHRGFRMNFGAAHALVWSCAGRTMITIGASDDSHSVTVITAEDESEPRMGLQGIDATEPQAIALLDGARDAFRGGAKFERDDKVTMAGL